MGSDPGSAPGGDAPPRWWVAAVLAAAVTAISSSGVLVRGMHGADPLAIAALRTLGAAALLSPSLRGGIPQLTRRDVASVGLAGLALALHFWTWFESLQHTTVLRSTLLVCTVPVFTAAAEWALHGRRPTGAWFVGLLLALPGVGLLTGDGGSGGLLGDGLALVAAALWAAYFLLGREVRQRVDVGATMTLVCAAASAVLLPVAVLTGTPLGGWPASTWALIACAIAGPQLVGHLGLVYAVRWLPASVVSAVTLLEPVGSAVLAALVLREVPGVAAVGGALLVLAGTALAARGASGDVG